VQQDRVIENRKEALVEGAHLRVAGEEAEGAAARDAQNALDGDGRGFLEFWARGSGICGGR